MKKLLLIAIVGLILFLSPSYVFALNQHATNLPNPGGVTQPPSPTGGGGNILVYDDGVVWHAPHSISDQALQDLGLIYTEYTGADFAGFETSLSQMKPYLVVFDDQEFVPGKSTLDALNAYVMAGGILVMESWTLATQVDPLWATLGIDQSSAINVDPITPMYQWNTASPIFSVPSIITNPLPQTYMTYVNINAIRMKVTGGGVALAGNTTTPIVGGAYIVSSNSGRTLLTTFMLDDIRQDGNGNGRPDAVDLWENMIAFAGHFPIPVGGHLSDNILTLGTVLPSVLLVSIAVVAAVTVSKLSVRKRLRGY